MYCSEGHTCMYRANNIKRTTHNKPTDWSWVSRLQKCHWCQIKACTDEEDNVKDPHNTTQYTTQLKHKHVQAHHQPVAPPDQPWPGASSRYVAECGQRPGGVYQWHAWRTPPSAPAAAPALVCPMWTAGSETMLFHSFHLGQKRTDAGKCKTDTYTSTQALTQETRKNGPVPCCTQSQTYLLNL